jgi:quercetin dioxygenase-like cupin family protein
MKPCGKLILGSNVVALCLIACGSALISVDRGMRAAAHEGAKAGQPIFKCVHDYKWTRILPDLGERSPEICFLHVDPKTGAAKLMIHATKAIHIRKHWHSANETHTMIRGTATFGCDGKRVALGPGSFNYMPAKMVHEAWIPADSLTFITVDAPWDVNWVEGAPTAADLTDAPKANE